MVNFVEHASARNKENYWGLNDLLLAPETEKKVRLVLHLSRNGRVRSDAREI